jgi:hypothetical protein
MLCSMGYQYECKHLHADNCLVLGGIAAEQVLIRWRVAGSETLISSHTEGQPRTCILIRRNRLVSK